MENIKETFCEDGVIYLLDIEKEIKIGDIAYSPQSDAIVGIDEENVDYANEEYTYAKQQKTEPSIIEANNKCLAFKGSPKQAIDFVDMMREIGIATGADFENILSDFIFNIEVELQNYGYLDEDFNKTDK